MSSALLRKSITDLTRRKSRTFFTVATLTLAVTSVGLFALPSLMGRSMHAAVVSDRLPDLTVYTRTFTPGAQLAKLSALPNVRAVEAGSEFWGQMYVGARPAYVYVRGIPAFSSQQVNVVHLASGSPPKTGEVLVDIRNGPQGLLHVGTGDTIRVLDATGTVQSLRVSGTAENLDGAQLVVSDGEIVLYASPATVASLSGGPGYTTFYFRLDDSRPAAVDATLSAIRRTFAAMPGFRGFSGLPDVRASGDWPGKSSYTKLTKFFYIVTVLALLAALVLIANTITTLVSEQTSEIGIMKAVGGRRRQIAAVYLKTALLLGALGSVAGIVIGLVIANLLTRYFGSHFYGVSVGIGADPLVILASAAVGLLGPPLAALPAIRRATRVPVREALEATGSAVGTENVSERLLRRIRFLPRSAQIGLRNVGRRRRRAFSTAVVIALAVGTLLALVGFGTGIANTSRASWHDHGEDFEVDGQGAFLDARAVDARAFHAGRRRRRAEVRRRRQARREGREDLGPPPRDDVPLPHRRRPLVHRRRGDPARTRRSDPARHRPHHRNPSRSDDPRPDGIRCRRLPGDRDRLQPAGERHRAVRAARDDACAHARRAGRRRRLVGADDLPCPRLRRPDDRPGRGDAHGKRLRHRHPDRVRPARERSRARPHAHHVDSRPRLPHRRDQHGRTRQRA